MLGEALQGSVPASGAGTLFLSLKCPSLCGLCSAISSCSHIPDHWALCSGAVRPLPLLRPQSKTCYYAGNQVTVCAVYVCVCARTCTCAFHSVLHLCGYLSNCFKGGKQLKPRSWYSGNAQSRPDLRAHASPGAVSGLPINHLVNDRPVMAAFLSSPFHR